LSFSIIIFCYNEQENISSVFDEVLSFLRSQSTDFEIIIVNDGSTDNTAVVCEQLKNTYSFVKLITHSANLGIGMALSNGYRHATKEYVCAIPGDGQFRVNELLQLKPFDASTYYSFYRTETNYNIYRKVLTWLNRLFNQHFLGLYLRDVNWIKVYRKEQIDRCKIELTSSLVESEICAKLYKLGVRPTEIPSSYLPRNGGVPKGGNWKTLRKAIIETIPLWWVVTKFKPSNRH
jgi:glycosyltransferase involved in cell wall biosynthesis